LNKQDIDVVYSDVVEAMTKRGIEIR